MSEELSLRMSLMDKQIIDADDLPIGRVDDVELEELDGRPVRVRRLLVGSEALGERLGGKVGGWIRDATERLRHGESNHGASGIEVNLIDQLEPVIRLRVPFDQLEDIGGLEDWLTENLIGRIPGARE